MYQSFWHRVPFVRFLLPFVGGISTAIFIDCNFLFCFPAFVVSFVAFVLAFRWLKKFRFALLNGVLLVSSLYFFGISLNLFQDELFRPDHFSQQPTAQYLLVRIDEPPAEKPRSFKLHAQVPGYLDSNLTRHECSGNLMLYVAKDSTSRILQYGDVLLIKQSLVRPVPPPQNPDEFDYRRYLSFNNIHYQAYLRGGDFSRSPDRITNGLFSWVYHVQAYFKSALGKNIGSASETGVAQALLYGYDDEISPDIVQAYANTGTLHVLAVSGMHVGLILWMLGKMLVMMNKTRRLKLLKNAIIIVCLWIYSLLCGLSPSILRATVMFTFILIGQMAARPTNVYNTLAISAFMLLITHTNMIANTGFQLSYMAVIGIVFLQPYIYDWLTVPTWVGNEIWKITAVSVAAQLTTFPLGLLYFHQFPNYFLFSNLIIIPLTTVIIYLGIMLIACSQIPFIGMGIGKLMYWGIVFTNSIVQFVERLPYSYIGGIHVSIVQTVVIFAALGLGITYFLQRHNGYLICALAMACCFFCLRGMHRYETLNQVKLVAYRVSSLTALNLVEREHSTLIIDTALWNDQGKVHFHMQQHFWHSGTTQQRVIYTDTVWKKFHVSDHTILISGKGVPLTGHEDTTVSLLIVKNQLPLKEILKRVVPREVLITCSIRPHVAARMGQLLAERNIPHYYVGDSGAFQLSLH